MAACLSAMFLKNAFDPAILSIVGSLDTYIKIKLLGAHTTVHLIIVIIVYILT